MFQYSNMDNKNVLQISFIIIFIYRLIKIKTKTREKGFEPLSKILEILILPIKLFHIFYKKIKLINLEF